jgi:hypothetical protein
MNRRHAKEIEGKVSNADLKEMFDKAKKGVKDWSAPSACNKTLTKGFAWNCLANNFNVDNFVHPLGKINMIHEFGGFLHEKFQPIPKKKKKIIPHHQEPVFK